MFYLRYAFIYAVWNAVLEEAEDETHALTDFHVRFVIVCPEAQLRHRLNALAFSNTFIRN